MATELTPVMKAKIEALVKTILDSYLADQKALSVKELAEKLGWTDGVVRETVAGMVRSEWWRVGITKKEVVIYSRDYPSMQHGTRLVEAYEPRKEYLAKLLAEALQKNVGSAA